MKLFGYNRKGFLYIDTGSNLISQQTISDESNMMNKFCSLQEFENYDVAKEAYKKNQTPKQIKTLIKDITKKVYAISDECDEMMIHCDLHQIDQQLHYNRLIKEITNHI